MAKKIKFEEMDAMGRELTLRKLKANIRDWKAGILRCSENFYFSGNEVQNTDEMFKLKVKVQKAERQLARYEAIIGAAQ